MTHNYPMIVYIEDDPNSIDVMRLLLIEALGYPSDRVLILPDSTSFMERIGRLSQVPDLFLLDIHVPPYDGFTILQALRSDERYAAVPTIALTASVMNEEINRLRTAGFSSVIAKPIDIDIMPSIIDRVLSGEQIWTIGG